jgi:hypothetical protein
MPSKLCQQVSLSPVSVGISGGIVGMNSLAAGLGASWDRRGERLPHYIGAGI